jgi:hypothetical protein
MIKSEMAFDQDRNFPGWNIIYFERAGGGIGERIQILTNMILPFSFLPKTFQK